MSETYIGCIDGKVISVRRGKKRIVLTVGSVGDEEQLQLLGAQVP